MLHVPRPQEIEDSTKAPTTMRVNIEGMRCQSCVKNIEGTIGSRSDVLTVKVDLEEKLGYIEYKTDEVTPGELIEAIEDMGFTASLRSTGESSSVERHRDGRSLQSAVSTCTIHIDGMTCMSCVKTITGERGVSSKSKLN